MSIHSRIYSAWLVVGLLVFVIASAEESENGGFVTLEDSNIACGATYQSDEVLVVDVEDRNIAGEELREEIEGLSGPYKLASDEPILIPKFFTDGKTRRQLMVRHAQEAVAERGCNLLVVLGVEFVEKQWEDPGAIHTGTRRWVTIGYALVWVGTR